MGKKRSSTVRKLLFVDATRAKGAEIVRTELRIAKGRIDLAAKRLGVSSRTLSRWLELEGLRGFASGLRKKNKIPGPR